MMAQTNREVVPQENQQVFTMASRLRDFTRINPPTLYGSKFEEDPHAMGFTTSEKAELTIYQLKHMGQT